MSKQEPVTGRETVRRNIVGLMALAALYGVSVSISVAFSPAVGLVRPVAAVHGTVTAPTATAALAQR